VGGNSSDSTVSLPDVRQRYHVIEWKRLRKVGSAALSFIPMTRPLNCPQKPKLITLIHLMSVERFGRMVTSSTVEPTQNSDKCSRFVALTRSSFT